MLKKFIKNNFINILIIIFLLFVTLYQFPYYIKKTGGIINLNERIDYKKNKEEGSLNMAYVSEAKGTLLNLMISKINPNWDVFKKDDTNIDVDEAYFRNKMMLKESVDHAFILAYKQSGSEVTIEKNKLYVTYIYSEANTDLKVKDQIISINNQKVNTKSDINDILSSLNENDDLKIEVINDNEKYTRYAKVIKIRKTNLIGIVVTEDKTLKLNPEIKIKFKNSESGSSGGLMMALALYNKLSNDDIIRGRKIVGTGTIDEYGTVGSIDGVKYKLRGAVLNKADIFIVPKGDNYKEALNEKEKNGYKIQLIAVDSFDEVIEYLKR